MHACTHTHMYAYTHVRMYAREDGVGMLYQLLEGECRVVRRGHLGHSQGYGEGLGLGLGSGSGLD